MRLYSNRAYKALRRYLAPILWRTRARPPTSLREYTDEEIAGFLRDDELDEEAGAIARQFPQDEQAR